MKNCKKCNEVIPSWIDIDGKMHNLGNRSYCLSCSPFKAHNTKKDIDSTPKKRGSYEGVKRFRLKKKLKSIEYLGGKCSKCGYSKCMGALHFHHKDQDDKSYQISKRNSWGFERIKTELDKCILLCANCHAEEHWGNGWL